MGASERGVHLGVDVGGTFTDAVLVAADGRRYLGKVPTTDPPTEGVLRAVDRVADRAGIDPAGIDQFRHGTTITTNALLARTGATTALVTTEGFRDVLEIARQDRLALYDLWADRPAALVPRRRRFTVGERLLPPDHPESEATRSPPAPRELDDLADDLAELDVDAVAVCLLHAYADEGHERAVRRHLAAALDATVVRSSEVLPEIREYERTATTAASAYLAPVLATYLDRLEAGCTERDLPEPWVMRSNGGVATATSVRERAVTTVLSGPAAGVVAARERVRRLGHDGFEGAISFDMGGTSADVCAIGPEGVPHTAETTVGDVPIRTPTVDVHTVGAGGGSIAWADEGGALRVGPESAGADPGPACYGRGGDRPTVTDAAVVLGVIDGSTALGSEVELDPAAAHDALDPLATNVGMDDAAAAAEGVVRVADATMTRAIRHVTVERGVDPRGYVLVAFGGAGGMHAAALADRLDIGRVVLPPGAGVLSASGLLAADERHDVSRTHRLELGSETRASIGTVLDGLTRRARSRCSDPAAASIDRTADLRYVGQSFELTVEVGADPEPASLAARFHDVHDRRRGYRLDEPVEAVTWRVSATVPTRDRAGRSAGGGGGEPAERTVRFPGVGPRRTTVHRGGAPSDGLVGPAVVERPNSTVVVPPGWQGRRADAGDIVLERGEP